MTPQERYQAVVEALAGKAGVDDPAALGRSRRGFGSSALTSGGRIFAMLTSGGAYVVKLPARRIDELVADGAGDRWDAGKGHPLKEWLAVSPDRTSLWLHLAKEALAHARRSR